MPIEAHIKNFFNDWNNKNRSAFCLKNVPEIYNEDSLKFELALYLRKNLGPEGYKVHFERNVVDFFINTNDYAEIKNKQKKLAEDKRTIKEIQDKSGNKKYIKHEIDIVVFKGQDIRQASEKYAIELKYSTTNESTEQKYGMLKDIAFIKALTNTGTANGLWNSSTKNNNKTVSMKFDKAYAVTLAENAFLDTKCSSDKRDEALLVGKHKKVAPAITTVQGNTFSNSKGAKITVPNFNLKWVECGNYCYYIVEA